MFGELKKQRQIAQENGHKLAPFTPSLDHKGELLFHSSRCQYCDAPVIVAAKDLSPEKNDLIEQACRGQKPQLN